MEWKEGFDSEDDLDRCQEWIHRLPRDAPPLRCRTRWRRWERDDSPILPSMDHNNLKLGTIDVHFPETSWQGPSNRTPDYTASYWWSSPASKTWRHSSVYVWWNEEWRKPHERNEFCIGHRTVLAEIKRFHLSTQLRTWPIAFLLLLRWQLPSCFGWSVQTMQTVPLENELDWQQSVT